MTLSEICELIVDCPHSTANDEGFGYPLIRTPNVGKGRLDLTGVHRVSENVYRTRIERATPQEGDIILAREAPVGNAAIIQPGQTVCLGQRVVLIRANRKLVLPQYLVYKLLSDEIQNRLKNCANGAVVAHLNMNEIRNLEIEIPDLAMQKAIAQVLTTIDDKIDLSNRINHNLEEQAQTLYKSWFVDFEPFKNGKFVESELGMIPEGWHVITLSDIASVAKSSINTQKTPDKLYSHYSIPAFDNSETPEEQIGSSILSNKLLIRNQSILFSKLNPRIKRVWNILHAKEDSVCSTEFIVYHAISDIDYPLLLSILNSIGFYDNILSMVNGATGSHQRFHAEDTMGYKIAYNKDAAVQFYNALMPIINQEALLKEERRQLISVREYILPKLMSGEITC